MKSPLDRGGLRFFLVLATLLAGASTHATILAGLPCILLGAALHFWAKGCLRQDRFVAMTGPYRFVRHPFYLANALIDGGIAVMSGSWPIRLVLPAWWLAVYVPVMRREERNLTAAFGSTYKDYRRRVPGLIPWRRPLPRCGPGFQWSNPNIADGEEIPRAVRILAYPLLLLAWTDLRTDPWAVLADGLKLLAISTLLMLYALSWALRRHQRRRRPILPPTAGRPALRAAAALGILTIAALAPAPPRRSTSGCCRPPPPSSRSPWQFIWKAEGGGRKARGLARFSSDENGTAPPARPPGLQRPSVRRCWRRWRHCGHSGWYPLSSSSTPPGP